MVATPERRSTRAPLRVLLVEDSDDDALLLLRALGRYGYETTCERVQTREAMRGALASSSWDVILSDYRMPRFSATEALELAREAGSEAPFIVVSGRIGEDVAVEAMRAGAYDYVMKDNLARLWATVERGLEETKARRELRQRDAILDAVRFAADQFLGEALSWEESVRTVLRRLGEAAGASRVYIFEKRVGEDGEPCGSLRYEWVAQGVPAQKDNPLLQAIPYRAAGYGRWVEMLSRGEPVYGNAQDFPEGEQSELRRQGILSIVLVPIFVEGQWWGQMGFDECSGERGWSAAEVGALGAAAGTLGAAIRRRRTEDRLRQSEERYRAVIEQATDGIYLLDAETRRIVETNPSLQRMLGYAAEELRGMEVYDFVAHPRENVESTIERTLSLGRRVVGDRRYRRKDGSLIDVEVGVSVISLDGRDVVCTIVRDVTERRRKDQALRDSEAELRAVFGAMNDVILVLDGDGRYRKVAPTTFSRLYRPPEELVGRTVHDTFPKEQADMILGSIRRALGSRERVDIEYGLEVGDGEMWFTATITPMTEDLVVAVARDVTGRKESERRLREAEFRYRKLVERIPATIYIQMPEFGGANAYAVAYMSPQVEKILGHPAQSFVEDSGFWNSVTHPEDLQRMQAETGRTDRTGGPFAMEYRMLHKDGGYRWIRDEAVLVSDEQDNPLYWQGVFSDVTERVRSEEALRESEERFRSAFDSAAIGMGLVGPDGRWIRVNRPLCDIVGYSEQELLNLTFQDITHPDDLDDDLRQVGRLLDGDIRAYQMEKRYLHKDGRVVWIMLSVSLMRDAEGNPLHYISQIEDITPRKQAEEALAYSEHRLRTIVETEPECVKVLGMDGSLLEMNPAGLSMIEADSLEQVRGNPVYEYIAPEHRADFVALTRRVLRGGSGTLEFELIGLKGTRRWLDTHAVPLRVAGGEISGLLAITRDITERKRAEQALKQSERLYRAVIEQASENIFLIDVATRRVVESNRAFREALGYSEEELHRMTLYDFVTADRESVDRNLRRTLEEGRALVGERRYRRKDGALLDVEVGGSIVLRDGRQTLVAVAHDITERKRNEEELRESEERFRSAFEGAAVGMALEGLDGRYLEVNRTLSDMLGYSLQEMSGMTFQEITHPDDLDEDLGLMRQLMAGEIASVQLEKRYVHKEGHVVWALVSASLVRDAGGEPLYVIGQVQDITQSKRAEAALEESRRTLATLMSNLPGMAYRCRNDEDWTMMFVSEGSLELTGYPPDDLIGNRRTTYADLIHPDDRDAVWESVQNALRERRHFQFTYRITTASGATKWVWEQGRGIFSSGGGLLALEGFVTDMTERARAQRLLEERVSTLSGIAGSLTLDLPVESTLDVLARSVVGASTAVACGIVLAGEGSESVNLFGSHGLPEGYTAGLQEAYRTGVQSPSLEAFRSRRPVLVRDLRRFLLTDPLYSPVHRFVGEVPWDVVYSLPLVSRGQALGAIFFCFLPGQEPGEDERVFLRAVADQAAIAVENVRLFAETRGKAALEERQRLARELHDSVSQALYGITLGAETARELLHSDDPQRAAEPLAYTISLAEAGMTEMRALIFELRPESLEKEGLVAALEKQAAAVEARHGIKVRAALCSEPPAPLEAKEAIYRIVQEALHNTVKHARAANVRIGMECDPDWIELEISDDGVGFDPAGSFPGHLGLRSMRERAGRLGGTFEVESRPGHGTRILARIPSG